MREGQCADDRSGEQTILPPSLQLQQQQQQQLYAAEPAALTHSAGQFASTTAKARDRNCNKNTGGRQHRTELDGEKSSVAHVSPRATRHTNKLNEQTYTIIAHGKTPCAIFAVCDLFSVY